MAIQAKCQCGRVLRVSSQHVGKIVACPHCQRKYRIPAQAKVEPEPQPENLDDDLLKGLPADPPRTPHPIELEQSVVATDALPPAAVPVDAEGFVQLDYAADSQAQRSTAGRFGDTIAAPKRSFWADAFMSFVYPVKGFENALTLMIILFVSAVPEIIPSFGMLGMTIFGSVVRICLLLIIFGWLAALYLSVIQITATGSDDLPGLRMENGFYDDIINPALTLMGAIAVVLAPSVLLKTAVSLGWVPQSAAIMLPFWLAAGIFLLPITLLLFAFDCSAMIFRLDLIVTTIFRTILPYLAICLMLTLVGFGLLVTVAGSSFVDSFMPKFLLDASLRQAAIGVTLSVVLNMAGTYLTIVAMRIIGLYYLHFKKRFAFVLE